MKKLTIMLMVLLASPATAQTALQQYIYNESGYMPPAADPEPYVAQAYDAPAYAPQVPVQQYQPAPQAYYPAPQPQYYEDPYATAEPAAESPGLRALLTSSGL